MSYYYINYSFFIAYYYDGQESYLKAVASEVELHNTLKLNVNIRQ